MQSNPPRGFGCYLTTTTTTTPPTPTPPPPAPSLPLLYCCRFRSTDLHNARPVKFVDVHEAIVNRLTVGWTNASLCPETCQDHTCAGEYHWSPELYHTMPKVLVVAMQKFSSLQWHAPTVELGGVRYTLVAVAFNKSGRGSHYNCRVRNALGTDSWFAYDDMVSRGALVPCSRSKEPPSG